MVTHKVYFKFGTIFYGSTTYNVLVCRNKQLPATIFLLLFKLAVAKIMEQGPVLILTFTAQQTMCAVDSKGKVVEGGEVSWIYHEMGQIMKLIFVCHPAILIIILYL